MTHRDRVGDPPREAAGDVGHRKARATPSESLGKPPFRSPGRTAGGRLKALPMSHIARGFSPTRRIARAISMGHYRRSLVLASNSAQIWQAASHRESWNMRWCGRTRREWKVGSGGEDYPVAEDFESPCDPPWPRVLANSLSRLPSNTCRREALGRPPHGRFLARARTHLENPSRAGTQHCC